MSRLTSQQLKQSFLKFVYWDLARDKGSQKKVWAVGGPTFGSDFHMLFLLGGHVRTLRFKMFRMIANLKQKVAFKLWLHFQR